MVLWGQGSHDHWEKQQVAYLFPCLQFVGNQANSLYNIADLASPRSTPLCHATTNNNNAHQQLPHLGSSYWCPLLLVGTGIKLLAAPSIRSTPQNTRDGRHHGPFANNLSARALMVGTTLFFLTELCVAQGSGLHYFCSIFCFGCIFWEHRPSLMCNMPKNSRIMVVDLGCFASCD
jgi:hypothetical protein